MKQIVDTLFSDILLLIIVIFLIAMFTVTGILHFQEFRHELKYINMEIKRTHGKERKYWKKQKRRFLFPFWPFNK